MRLLASAIVTVIVLLVARSPAALAQHGGERSVQQLAQRAQAMADGDRWADALVLYRQALDQTHDASTHRDLNLNVGVCLMGTGHYLAAIDAFESFVREGGDRSTVTDLLGQAHAALGTLELEVEPASAEVLIDGLAQAGDGAHRRISVDPGEHRVEVRAEGYESRSGSLSSRSGASASLTLALTAHAASSSAPVGTDHAPGGGDLTSDPVFWIVLGAIAVGVGVGVGVGVYFGTQPQVDAGTTGVVLMGLGGTF